MNGLSRKTALWLAGALVLTGGLAFASPSIPLLSDNTSVTEASPSPDPSLSPEPTESPEASEAPEPSESPETGDAKRVRSTEGCPEGFTGNHGQFVSGTTDRPRSEAAHSDCGKKVKKDKSDATVSPEPTDGPDSEVEESDVDNESGSGHSNSGSGNSHSGHSDSDTE